MTYTFLKAQGNPVGKSKVEADKLDVARELLELARATSSSCRTTTWSPSKPEAGAETKVVAASEIPDGWFGMDIGPATIAAYSAIIKQAGTVVWNGPMGKFEVEALRERDHGDRRGPGRFAGGDGRRRRRVGRGHREVRPCRARSATSRPAAAPFLESLEGKSFNSLKVIPDA